MGVFTKFNRWDLFNHHIKENITKTNRGIEVIKKPNNTLVQANINYGDITCDQLNNESSSNKLKTIQYNAALPKLKWFEGHRKLNRGLCTLYKIKTYTIRLPPKGNDSFNTRNSRDITTY